jgi:hypothetical protein
VRIVLVAGWLVALTMVPAFGQSSSAAKAQNGAAFDPHDISGVWYRVSPFQTFSNVDNRQPGMGGGGRGLVFQEAPLTAAGKAAFDKNKPGYGPRAQPLGNDPMSTCDPLGIPRMINAELASAHAFWELVVTKDRVFQFMGFHHDWREIWTDGRKLPSSKDLEPTWDGYSVGRWDGDTFVVDTIGLDDRTWLDKFGYPHTDQAKLQERYRRVDHDTLELKMTLTDPEYYSRPWDSDTKIFKSAEVCLTGKARCLGDPILEFPTGEAKIKNWDEQVYCVPSEEYKFNERVRNPAGGKGTVK